jgi:hypothetical protein
MTGKYRKINTLVIIKVCKPTINKTTNGMKGKSPSVSFGKNPCHNGLKTVTGH